MLERNVMIDGHLYVRHELAMVTLVIGNYAVASVRSYDGSSDSDAQIETSHQLPLSDGKTLGEWEELTWALPAFEEWVDTAGVLDEVLDILTDEQAETVPQLYPEWKVDTFYTVGKRVRYNDKLYRCEQAHTSQEGYEPATTPALWTRTAAEGEILEWVQPTGAQDAYDYGTKVTHNGKTWISTYEGKNVWEPGVFGWSEATE